MSVQAVTQGPNLKVEHLPFTVTVVKTYEQLKQAVSIRQAAYARHVPEFAATLEEPEAADTEPGTTVLLARSRLDGSALGTVRMQTNDYAPLEVEHAVALPRHFDGKRLAEISRLGVVKGSVGSMVKHALLKGVYQFSRLNRIEQSIVTARSPVDRQYTRLLFDDLYPDVGYIPMKHVHNIPHRVLAFDINTAVQRFEAVKHPLTAFYFQTTHPDIDIRREGHQERSAANEATLKDQETAVA